MGASSGARHVRSRKIIPGDEATIQRMGRVVPGCLARVVHARLRHGSGIQRIRGVRGQETQEGEGGGMAGPRKLRERGSLVVSADEIL